MTNRAAWNVSFGNLRHSDSRLHTGINALLLQKILKCQRVHDGTQHAHVVGTGTVHPRLGKFGATEKVAATDHDGGLYLTHGCRDLPSNIAHHLGGNTHFTATKNFAGKFE